MSDTKMVAQGAIATPRTPRSPALAAVLLGTAALVGVGLAGPAEATNGYFAHGQGPKAQGMAGAGTAFQTSPVAAATNPALAEKGGRMAGACAEVFMPDRESTVDGVTYKSANTAFAIPCLGANTRLDDQSTLGAVLIGNGGMNTDYDPIPAFGNTRAGVDLAQAILGVNYARRMGAVTFGIMPTLAYQRFKASGLENFDAANMSTAPGSVTNLGYDGSWGYGVRLGGLWDVNKHVSLAAAWQSRTYMTKFDKYKGLFAEQGDFDIPAALRLGVAVRPMDRVTVAVDYERIWYSDVKAIGNTGVPMQTCLTGGGTLLGADDGCGFGWKDMDVWRIGLEYQATDALALRTGYSHASDFTDNSELMFNILAPATIKHHASVGFSYVLSDTWGVSGAYTHGFRQSFSGPNPMTPGDTIRVSMEQNIVSLGLSYRW